MPSTDGLISLSWQSISTRGTAHPSCHMVMNHKLMSGCVCVLCMCAHVCRHAPAIVPMGGHRATLGNRFSFSALFEVESLVGSVAKLSIRLADAWASG